MEANRSRCLLPQVNALVSETSMLSLDETYDQDDLITDQNNFQIESDDGLGDIWMEMTLALESSKDVARNVIDQSGNTQEECVHSVIFKEDLGFVCRVCGIVEKSIENVFDYQWVKGSGSQSFYMSEPRSAMATGSKSARGIDETTHLAAHLQALSTSKS